MSGILFLPFVDYINTCGCQCSGNDVFPIEWLAKAETGSHCSNHRNQRVVDCHLTHRIASQQFVVETEPECRDANEQKQDGAAPHCDVWQCASHHQSGDDKQCASHAKAVACSDKHVNALVESSRHQCRTGTT